MFDNDNRYFGYLGDYWDWYVDRLRQMKGTN
jgi:hypothetical protein